MPQSASTLSQETLGAVRGVAALVVGDRRAPAAFDLTPRGMLGAMAAFLIIVAATHFGPMLLGAPGRGAGRAAFLFCALFAAEIAGGMVLLRVIGRMDAFVPFLTTTFWARGMVLVVFAAAALVGLPPTVSVMISGLVLLVIEINIGRLIVTLPPLQVAGLVGAQLLGSFIGLSLLGMAMPLPEGAVPQV